MIALEIGVLKEEEGRGTVINGREYYRRFTKSFKLTPYIFFYGSVFLFLKYVYYNIVSKYFLEIYKHVTRLINR